MDINDKELFEAAIDEPAEVDVADPVNDGPSRDELGRFAPKEPAAEVVPEPAPVTAEPKQEEAHVPSWRLRETTERAERAEREAARMREDFQRQIAELSNRLPKETPQPRPDLYEDPNAFVDHGVRQAVDPIKSEISQLREFYSQREAVREFGQEKVQAARTAIEQGMASRDPEAWSVYQRAMQSMDPYGEIVKWHMQKSVISTIGNDPEAWFQKRMQEHLASPENQAKVMQQIQQSARSVPQRTNITQLPPSLNKVAGAQIASDDDTDMSDAALFRHASR